MRLFISFLAGVLFKETVLKNGFKFIFGRKKIKKFSSQKLITGGKINGLLIAKSIIDDLNKGISFKFDKIAFINYELGGKKYINYYLPYEEIKYTDFDYHETKIRNKYNNLLIAKVENNGKIEYLTSYLKMFFNQNKDLTPKILYQVYPKDLKTPLTIMDSKKSYDFNLNELI
jgi:hypothetical protein